MNKKWHQEHLHGSNAVYGLGFIGSAVYFIGQANTFWQGVLGFLKAIVNFGRKHPDVGKDFAKYLKGIK